MAQVLTKDELDQAIRWNAVNGYDWVTIAQHFGVTVEDMKAAIRNRPPGRITFPH